VKEQIAAIVRDMERHGYVADRSIATAVHLARELGKPLLVEGEAGVGKTEIAKVMASALETELIRLQCYEGLDVHTSLYEWNYQKQLLRIRMEEAREGEGEPELESEIFSRAYLLERPLLRAITREEPPVLLIDEIDRADEEFEAFLLEILSDFQVTVPELGTIRARTRPHVILTSNGTRELSDALRRRCLYLWIDLPDLEKELRILETRVPELPEGTRERAVRFVQRLRGMQLYKTPGVAETLDWARALGSLEPDELDGETVAATLGCLLKDRQDVERMDEGTLGRLLVEAGIEPGAEEGADGTPPGETAAEASAAGPGDGRG
jgi:MoxR-like ATPase